MEPLKHFYMQMDLFTWIFQYISLDFEISNATTYNTPNQDSRIQIKSWRFKNNMNFHLGISKSFKQNVSLHFEHNK